jgi:5-methylcytosine-specific restriction enzyme A
MSILEELRPTARERIIDLVSRAGVDTTAWSGPADPRFCYEWAFEEPGKVVVVNLAYRDMTLDEASVTQTINVADFKHRYAAGNGLRTRRLDTMAQAIERAYRTELPVRVVIFDGDLADESSSKPTRVESRKLDEVPWAVTSCDSNVYVLTRGASPERFIDQFTPEERGMPPERQTVVTQVFERRADVRRRARQRANGKCEYCAQPGFATSSGEIYLETHHIVPLSENGLDADDNVVALCANHHREAHFGGNRSKMSSSLLQTVSHRSRQ